MEQEQDGEVTSLFADTFDNPGQDILSNAEAGQPEAAPPEPVPEEKGEHSPEERADQPRDEAGRFAPKPKEGEAAPPAAESEPQHVPVAALKDERTKRQSVEARLAQAEAYIAQMQRQPAQPPAPQQPAERPDPVGALLEDPQKFIGHAVQQALAPVQESLVQQRLAASLHAVASQAPDFGEALATVQAHVAANPQDQVVVARALRSHPVPAQWVLEQGRRLKELNEFQQWRQQRAQPPAPETPPAPSAPRPSLPASLATARGIGAQRQAEITAASPLESTWRE